jgi:hypothetical protein
MPGLVPGIHVFLLCSKDVDGRDKPGHDEKSAGPIGLRSYLAATTLASVERLVSSDCRVVRVE